MILFGTLTVMAHGGEEAEIDVPTLVKQSIAFLEGINDIEMAEERLNDAINLNEEQQLADSQKLKQAQQALENSEIEEATILMVEAIGGNPELDLEFNPAFKLNGINIVLLLLSIVLVGLGLLVLLRKQSEQEGGKANE